MTGPVGDPNLGHLPPDAPATVEDVRATRRWTWVAFVWAIAASAIAVIALIQAGKDNSNNQNARTTTPNLAPQLSSFQKQTNDRLDAFSGRLNDTAAQADVAKLDKRLSKVETNLSNMQDDSGKQTNAITQLQKDVQDLQKRMQQVESNQQNSGQSTGTTTTP